ncbi:MAG: hypothetical protein GXO62_01215 [Epsilonproteobacteria bacterium]|nr:hypothetical protein [Campylobacterota bacterium]
MEFFKHFFAEPLDVIAHHKRQIQAYNLIEPKINYIDLFKFLTSAANFLYEIDFDVISGLPTKMYKDIEALIEYYKKIKKLNPSHVFYNIYLPSLPEYKKLVDTIESLEKNISKYETIQKSAENELSKFPQVPKKEEDLKVYKSLKKKQVDAIYYVGKYKEDLEKAKEALNELEKKEEQKFFSKFDEFKNMITEELRKIINTKLYYFDKLIWYNASKSAKVNKFFKNSNIKGDINSKTFLKYQLQHIDEAKTLNSDWISYLKSLIKVIE